MEAQKGDCPWVYTDVRDKARTDLQCPFSKEVYSGSMLVCRRGGEGVLFWGRFRDHGLHFHVPRPSCMFMVVSHLEVNYVLELMFG